MDWSVLRRRFLALLSLALLTLPQLTLASGELEQKDDLSGDSESIIARYLQASQLHEDVLRGASMEVDINASVPGLKKEGRLRALRKISKVGQITYRVLGFQGDNTVKKEVIARYLTAEQQAQGDEKMSITPANYKFKLKGRKSLQMGGNVYIFALTPRKKQVGLFKGEVWLDATTCLPVLEKGRLVKNPSIFFRRVDFERAFSIQNGAAVPSHMKSTIDTRLIGKVELNIDYTHYAQDTASDDGPAGEATVAGGTVQFAK